MENKDYMGSEEKRIERLLNGFLASRNTLKSSAAETSFHFDEDSLAAFVEGNLGEREGRPLVRHLASCGFCRHKTVELVRFGLEFEGGDASVETVPSEPSRISEVLAGLFAKIFGSADGAVFAHNEKDDDDETPADEGDKKEDGK